MEKKKLLIALLLSVFVSYVNAQFCKQLTSEEQSKAKKRINIEQNEKRVLSYFAVNENYQEEFKAIIHYYETLKAIREYKLEENKIPTKEIWTFFQDYRKDVYKILFLSGRHVATPNYHRAYSLRKKLNLSDSTLRVLADKVVELIIDKPNLDENQYWEIEFKELSSILTNKQMDYLLRKKNAPKTWRRVNKAWSLLCQTDNFYKEDSTYVKSQLYHYYYRIAIADELYKNDKTYSDETAHYSDVKGATATFTFKGTAVDVYSRTNGDVGLIRAVLYKGTEVTKSAYQMKYIDNVSQSGDYYQIPTLSFDDLEYGTYTVQITAGAKGQGTTGTYYLDGIRVYNPLGNVDANSVAGKAYSEAGESNAQYISVRKDLLDSTKVNDLEASINGSLFIDKSENKVGDKTEDIGTYKDYGPKNEVYVKENQGVAFKIKEYDLDNNKVFIGLKSPQGKDVRVKVTSGEHIQYINLSSAADLYYEITPNEDGNVVIENMTDNLLSITKVRITSKNATTIKNSLISTPELMSYVEKFDSLSVKQDNNKDDSLGKDDIDIENPEDKNDEAVKPVSIWQKIMESIKIWFGK